MNQEETSSSSQILLCSDLDRTLVPNGEQEESPAARPLLHELARHPQVKLAYVTGRHLRLIHEAIETYELPIPDYAIGDVGTTIYEVVDGQWGGVKAWQQEIARDWCGRESGALLELLSDVVDLEPQEPEKQNTFKLSYYAPETTETATLFVQMQEVLRSHQIRASLIWSIDEQAQRGLLDVLPERATKLHGVRFLMKHGGFTQRRTVFAGDSGNDLPALTSELQAVLVRNARNEVRQVAVEAVAASQREESLYVARGEFLGMNGNYAAGVLEGLAHFIPEMRPWLESHLK